MVKTLPQQKADRMDVKSQLEQFCMHCGHKITYLSHQAGSSIFCPKCGQSVQILGDASSPVKAESSQIAATSSDIIPPADVHISIEGQQYGPYTEAEIDDHLKTGQVAPTTLAWREGASGWLPLNELLEPAIDQTAATNPQPTTATSANPQPEEDDLENDSQEIKPSGVEQPALNPFAVGVLIIVTGGGILVGLSELYSWIFPPKNEEVQHPVVAAKAPAVVPAKAPAVVPEKLRTPASKVPRTISFDLFKSIFINEPSSYLLEYRRPSSVFRNHGFQTWFFNTEENTDPLKTYKIMDPITRKATTARAIVKDGVIDAIRN